jgi:MYXO-CTERM domain-containing protein
MAITVALNWIDEANRTLDESRDGPAHTKAMDACDDADALRTSKRLLATEAATALLHATLDPLLTKEAKMAATDVILDKYLSYSPGCTFDNGWCDAPERQYKDPAVKGLGCSSGGAGGLGLLGALLALALRPRRRSPGALLGLALLLAGSLGLPAGSARADEPAAVAAPAVGEPHAPPAPVVVPVAETGPRDPSEGAWGAYLGVSGSVDKPAAAFQLGLRRRVSTHWTFGLDGEWNPWVSLYGNKNLRQGSFNGFGTAILRFPLAYENFNLRTTVGLGVSYLLFDLYGAPKGSLGLYGTISPLGLEWKVSRFFNLIVNPLNIAVPVPQLRGVPLSYPQYRFSIGLGFVAG